ncbi:hypothetical protein F4782DRAFT_531114 [Xylaria castorea]|nr:hypothetical protein F4782DRAFT_531114 [Xylaria castorea]
MAHARPLSPWAQRFRHGLEGREAFLDDIVHHSGFAPELPRLHPKHYADKPPPADSARTTSQLDHLFASEAFQIEYLRGSYSWMVGPIMRHVRFSQKTGLISGGHQAADYGPVDPSNAATERREDVALRTYHSERIQVDESKWFSFLKKDRWLDWDEPQPLLDGGNWSVDNPKVWEILSISIELLDRVLKALVADKHIMLETVMYGMNIDWKDAFATPPPFKGANFLLSLPYVKRLSEAEQMPCPIDFVAQFTPEEFTTRLEYLLSEQTWSFIENYTNSQGVWGITIGGLGNLIVIDVGPIRRLMTDDITIAERCMLHFMIMTTMLHELFHALFQCRKVDQSWPADLQPINLVRHYESHEPLVDDDAATELGYAAEQRIFGGRLDLGPRHCDDLPFGVFLMGWPTPFEGSIGQNTLGNHPTFQAGRKMYITRVPALFTSKLLSAEFWDDATIPQKSANYFHSNRIFASDTAYPGPNSKLEYNVVRLHSDMGIALEAGEREMVDAWRERIRDWNQRRAGWFKQARREWRRTPWSDLQSRQLILKFGISFVRRDRVDCRYIAQQLLERIAQSEDKNIYLENLPPLKQNNSWVFHAIGLLMLAALPIMNHKIRSRHTLSATYRFISSRETAEALKREREICRGRLNDERQIPPSVLYDPLGRPGQVVDADHFYQEDCLDVLGRLVGHLASNDVAVSHPWLREIMNIAEDLRRQRRDVSVGARHKRSWAAAWRFRVPAYDNSVSRFQHGRWTVQI